jgi:NAD(P)-dependent dehydrogenase (short-subunit alcohol dehydrogenase family)
VGWLARRYLADAYKARLILAGRSPFPDRSAWASWLTTHDDDDPVSRKIRHVQALEALGSDVLVLCADVSDQDQADRVVTLAAERFGAHMA